MLTLNSNSAQMVYSLLTRGTRMIRLQNVSKTYGKKDTLFRALNDVSIEVLDSSVVAIVGKSGSGKSTLMHIMSGLDQPSSGAVSIDDQPLQNMSQKQVDSFRAESMGFIFQSFFVEPRQTAYQNIALPLEIANVPKTRRKALVEDALASVDLLDKIASPAANLSGGQKQRLAIARAIVNKPAYIFADEPTGNLDTINGDNIIKLLFDLNKKMGSTLVIVTHDPELASRCGLQISMKDGEITNVKKQSKVVKK